MRSRDVKQGNATRELALGHGAFKFASREFYRRVARQSKLKTAERIQGGGQSERLPRRESYIRDRDLAPTPRARSLGRLEKYSAINTECKTATTAMTMIHKTDMKAINAAFAACWDLPQYPPTTRTWIDDSATRL